jgi:GT2 family glycosyltransferase
VSIVIPNLNSPVVDRTLDAIRQQDLVPTSVLVVGLDEPGLVFEDQLVRLLPTDGPASPAVARNIGISRSRSDIVCLTDADCIPEPDWLSRITAPLRQGVSNIVGGGVTFGDLRYWALADHLSWFHDYLPTAKPGCRVLLPTLNICMTRDVIDEVGLLDESFPRAAGEDAEWTTRMRLAGYRLMFDPGARVRHAPPSRSSLQSVWRHGVSYGRYSVKVNPHYADALKTPVILRHWQLLLLLAPLVSLLAALRVFLQDAYLWRYLHVLPGVWITKLAWVLGAVRTLRLPASLSSTPMRDKSQ